MWTNDGLQALLFTSDGDLRTALNNMQSTWAGFEQITEASVYKACSHFLSLFLLFVAISSLLRRFRRSLIAALRFLSSGVFVRLAGVRSAASSAGEGDAGGVRPVRHRCRTRCPAWFALLSLSSFCAYSNA